MYIVCKNYVLNYWRLSLISKLGYPDVMHVQIMKFCIVMQVYRGYIFVYWNGQWMTCTCLSCKLHWYAGPILAYIKDRENIGSSFYILFVWKSMPYGTLMCLLDFKFSFPCCGNVILSDRDLELPAPIIIFLYCCWWWWFVTCWNFKKRK